MPVSRKDRSAITAYHFVLGDITPIDVFVFEADANKISERVIDAASAVPAGQNVALGMRFFADNFADEELALLRLHRARCVASDNHGSRQSIATTSVVTILEKTRVRCFRRFEVHIGKRRASFSVKKKAVPGKADISTGKAVPGCFNLVHRSELRLGGDELLAFGVDKKLVHLEFTKFC